MESIRARIQHYRSSLTDDETFIARLNDLIKEHGDHVCPIIFNTLTSMDLAVGDAVNRWDRVLEHREELIRKLDRNVSLITAISDYLDCSDQTSFQHQLIESQTLERAIQGTTRDYLTGLYNRTYFDETYRQQTSFAKRYNSNLSILFLDIDDFKDINDNHGHIAGDQALRSVATIINQAKRNSDISARFGGEEFVLLMPHTESDNAYILAERLRFEIEQTPFTYQGKDFHLTISGGLASFPQHSTDPEDLLVMADSALYLAKGAGKNNIMQFRKENRRYLRMKLCQPILAKELGFRNNHVYPGISKDIGMGGIMFQCGSHIPVGTMLKLNVPVHGSTPILLLGRVVRVEQIDTRTYDIGMRISFKEMAKQANNEISSFLKGNLMVEG
ncbi:diguanylate cyclase [Desulfopila sp. IMCC35008]|uniref:diguanylate cyclase n=1 Tax=Desulfopila sp. IMCC35008 TaxID=2653858 RepID=UPI0013D23EB9|nr:diguanylate cyclase [Desulfopila sp. IMCC35008]